MCMDRSFIINTAIKNKNNQFHGVFTVKWKNEERVPQRHEIHNTLEHSFGNQSEDLNTVGKAHKPTSRKCCDYL